jgi:hypothetical protein
MANILRMATRRTTWIATKIAMKNTLIAALD